MIVEARNYLICFENYVIGHQWLKQFFKQNLEYYIQKQKSLAAEQKYCYGLYNINNYFKKIT